MLCTGGFKLHGDRDDSEYTLDDQDRLVPGPRVVNSLPRGKGSGRDEAPVEKDKLVYDTHKSVALAKEEPTAVRLPENVAKKSEDLRGGKSVRREGINCN